MTAAGRMPVPTVEILRYVGVPEGQTTQALGRLVVLLAERYDLDPALKHVEVIRSKGGLSVYISADGWRFVADRSGELDGLTFENVEEGDHGWRATALVWRKGCSHPFEGRAGCGFAEGTDDPEAMAMTRATRRALRNAFASKIRVEPEYADLLVGEPGEAPELEPVVPAEPVDVSPPRETPGTPVAAPTGVPGPLAAETISSMRPRELHDALTARQLAHAGTLDEMRTRLYEHERSAGERAPGGPVGAGEVADGPARP